MDTEDLLALLNRLGLKKIQVRRENITACCPSHDEDRPSWGISINPPHLHGCFSCGYRGTLASLLSRYGFSDGELKTLKEASSNNCLFSLEYEPKSSGFAIPELPPEILFPFGTATSHPEARRYLEGRRIDLPVADQAGLLFDTNTYRILFPWRLGSKLIAVTGRSILPGEKVKTLPFFKSKKGLCFYTPDGLLAPKKYISIVVEGEIDALRLWQLGFSVVALGYGTIAQEALTRYLVELDLDHSIVLFFDDDSTGVRLRKQFLKMTSDWSYKVGSVSYKQVKKLSKYRDKKLDPAELLSYDLMKMIGSVKYYADWKNI